MKKFLWSGGCLLVAATVFMACQAPEEKWQLVWSEEFEEEGTLSPADWNFEQGFVRNEELQWYQPDNAAKAGGCLVIEGRQERVKNPYYFDSLQWAQRMEQYARSQGNRRQNQTSAQRRQRRPFRPDWRQARAYASYTSSSVTTREKHEFLYGRIEVKARIPVAGGSWPAIWTLGNELPWPSCGEVDIMEYYRVQGVPHILANAAWGNDEGRDVWRTTRTPFTHFTEKDPDWAQKFHLWRMDWTEDFIRLYLDDELLNEVPLDSTFNGKHGEYKNPFRQPHYLLLNLAIGGRNGGEPDTTQFPLRYEIDYVRVYQTPAQQKAQKELSEAFRPGKIWKDNRGMHINAHGGGILTMPDRYYWFGEHKDAHTSNALVGVNCYSSADLLHWTYEGVALSVTDDPASDITRGCILERPKVIYNAQTGKYVMYFHLELKGRGYEAARCGVAVSDSPTGPYTFLRSYRPNAGVWPQNWTEDDRKAVLALDAKDFSWEAVLKGAYNRRDHEGGQMARDMTLFVDEDGKAYHIFSSEENYTLNIAELSDDYLTHSGRYVTVAPGGHNEAPALFKKEGTYWMITSGCTGWAPNEARMFSAPSIWGPWTQHPNPCVGPNKELTFGAQSTFVLPVRDKPDTFIFMADIWRPSNQIDSRYVWLLLSFKGGLPVVEWQERWTLEADKDR